MDGLQIIIDDRERAIIPQFEKLDKGLPYKVERLTVGDYAILYRSHILFTIERKTWVDLAASIKDLRSKNVQNLIELREKIGCHIIYLIEGNPLPKQKIRFARIPFKNLRSHLDHLAFRDSIHIVHTKDEFDTARRINEIALNYITISPSPLKKIDEKIIVECKSTVEDTIQNEVLTTNSQDETSLESTKEENPEEKQETKGGNEAMLKEKKKITPNVILYRLWGTLPGITTATTSILIDKYKIIDYLLGNVSVDSLAMERYPSGHIIGPERAKKMLKISNLKDTNNKPYYINLLKEIPLITRDTAKKLLKTWTIQDILEGKISKEKLAEFPKTHKKRIGSKAATNILMHLGIKAVKS